MGENDLSKSKIININDFIFRQNLEFYPNLNGLKCNENILTYSENGEVLASEVLTFDLRTLPGNNWNLNPLEFMDMIRLNKNCIALIDTADFINKHAFDHFFEPGTNENNFDLKTIKKRTEIYYEASNNTDFLCEAANYSLGYFSSNVIVPFDEGRFSGSLINESIEEGKNNYLALHPEKKAKARVLELTSPNLPVPFKEEETPTKAGFINIAILLYGIINIGMILAIAFMK